MDRPWRIKGYTLIEMLVVLLALSVMLVFSVRSLKRDVHTPVSFVIDEIVMKDGELYAEASEGERPCTLRLYPLGENTVGIKDLDADLVFGGGALTLYGVTGKKLAD